MIDIKELRKVAELAEPGPWGPWTGNYPFYVDVRKPSASLSKHDDQRPTYWAHNDAAFVLTFNPKMALELLDEIERLKEIEAIAKNIY